MSYETHQYNQVQTDLTAMKQDKRNEIIRDVGGMIQNLASDDMIETQVRINAFYQYIFDIWQDGYDEACKSAWIKIKN